jgi:cell division septum initiation protein DivIVA
MRMGHRSSKPGADERWTFDLEHEKKHAQWAWDTNQESLAYCLDGFIAEHERLTRERDELRAEVGAWVHRQAELQAQIALQERRFREAEAEWVERFDVLRAALEQIASAVFYAKQTPVEAKNLQDMAREALNP